MMSRYSPRSFSAFAPILLAEPQAGLAGAASNWSDIPTACDFFHVHEGNLLTDGDPDDHQRRAKNFRLQWPATVRDEVLARLHARNAERAAEEARLGLGGRVGSERSGAASSACARVLARELSLIRIIARSL